MSKAKGKVNGKVNGACQHTPQLPADVLEQLENLESRLCEAESELESERYRRSTEDELLGGVRKIEPAAR